MNFVKVSWKNDTLYFESEEACKHYFNKLDIETRKYVIEPIKVRTLEEIETVKVYNQITLITEIDGEYYSPTMNIEIVYLSDKEIQELKLPRITIGNGDNLETQSNVPIVQLIVDGNEGYFEDEMHDFIINLTKDYERIEARDFDIKTREEIAKDIAEKYKLNYVKEFNY